MSSTRAFRHTCLSPIRPEDMRRVAWTSKDMRRRITDRDIIHRHLKSLRALLAGQSSGRGYLRLFGIAGLVLLVSAAHWWTPRGSDSLHVLHVVLRKLYILPVVMAAIWFDLRGALLATCAVAALYLPHVVFHWGADRPENVNQVSELVTIVIVAVLSGVFVTKEKAVLRRLKTTYENVVAALVRALNMREHGTGAHSLRVRDYTLRLATEMKLPEEVRSHYVLGALLHDIGKIGVPDAILLKAGPLSEEEWATMRKHPEMGRQILAALPDLEGAQEIVCFHHERFDGSGYPQRLKGKQIPLGARIFAVVDVLDALTSSRPYRKPSTFQEAWDHIKDGAGREFDPDIVAVFQGVSLDEWQSIAESVESSEDTGKWTNPAGDGERDRTAHALSDHSRRPGHSSEHDAFSKCDVNP